MKRRSKSKHTKPLPVALQAFAWNLPQPHSEWGRAYVALEALETATETIWKTVPGEWFNLSFAERHGRPATKRLVAEFRRLKNKPWPKYPSA